MNMKLTQLQREFLRALKQNCNKDKTLKLSEIIEEMEFRPSSPNQIMKSLEKKGLIKFESSYEAGRAGQVTIVTLL